MTKHDLPGRVSVPAHDEIPRCDAAALMRFGVKKDQGAGGMTTLRSGVSSGFMICE